MSNTPKNIPMAPEQWIDVYAASGFAVGTQVKMQAIRIDRPIPIRICVSTTKPDGSAYTTFREGEWVKNDVGDVGLWVWCAAYAEINVSGV